MEFLFFRAKLTTSFYANWGSVVLKGCVWFMTLLTNLQIFGIKLIAYNMLQIMQEDLS